MNAFEVQIEKNGRWTINSIQNSFDESVQEALALRQHWQSRTVRVIEEYFDPSTKSYRSKVVFLRKANHFLNSGDDEDLSGLIESWGRHTPSWMKRLRAIFLRWGKTTKSSCVSMADKIDRYSTSYSFIAAKLIILTAFGVWTLVNLRSAFAAF